MWAQEILTISRPRGCHLITNEVVSLLSQHLRRVEIGMLHLFCMHTSCSIAINENYDSDVRKDLEDSMSRIVPQGAGYRHSIEGPDDMPAHVKSVLIGVSHGIPVRQGKLMLGTWQGIYLCEHRDAGGERRIVLTLQGSPNT